MSVNNNAIVIDHGPDENENFIRIGNTGTVEPGYHWECTSDVEGVVSGRNAPIRFETGCAYLVTRLINFDGTLHSVELLDDPSRGTGLGIVTLPLLLKHFKAMTVDDAETMRQRQIQAVNQRVAELQKQMNDAAVDPAFLEPVVREGLLEWEAKLAREKSCGEGDDANAPGAKTHLPAVGITGRFNLNGAVTNRITTTDIDVFRHMAQREGKIAEIRAKWLSRKVEELGGVLKRLAPFFSEHAAVGLARAHDAGARAAEIEKGLRSLRLYTGEGVEVVEIARGASAARSEPLTVYQRKLFMDEEFAVWTDVDELFDYVQEGTFFEALRENEGLRQQLVPAPRGVVAMAVRRSDIDYSPKTIHQALEAEGRNHLNKQLFLLVRDGDNWYQVFSGEPSHELSPRLFPTRTEMDAIFTGLDGEQIAFDDLRFSDRSTAYDRKALVYKRFLILACGLDHRAKLFGSFYPDNEALNFISLDFQSKYMRFVADDDADVMLGDGVADVDEFIAQNHSQLAPGCRVVVFCEQALKEQAAAPGAFNNGVWVRDQTVFHRMVDPQLEAIIATVRRDKDDLVVMVPVERRRAFKGGGWGASAVPLTRTHHYVRVALNKLDNDSVAYLIADTIRPSDLRPYIFSRAQRVQHCKYIYAFKRAMRMLGDEERANAPALEHLQAQAGAQFGLAPEAAAIAAAAAVQAWRQKNPEAEALPTASQPAQEALAFELAEASYAFTHALPLVSDTIAKLGGRLVRLMRGKRGVLIAYYEQPETEKDQRIKPWGWVGRRTFSATGKPSKDASESVWMPAGRITGESELFRVRSELAQRTPEEPGRLAKLRAMADMVAHTASFLPGAFVGERCGVSDAAWAHLMSAAVAKGLTTRMEDSDLLIPVAVDTASGVLVGVATKLFKLLYHYGSDAQRASLVQMGYAPPKPPKDARGGPAPYAGPRVRLWADGYVRLDKSYVGQVGLGVSTVFPDYAVGDGELAGPDRLDEAMNSVLAPADATEGHAYGRRLKRLDASCIWLPSALRSADGLAALSRHFPGLPTA